MIIAILITKLETRKIKIEFKILYIFPEEVSSYTKIFPQFTLKKKKTKKTPGFDKIIERLLYT